MVEEKFEEDGIKERVPPKSMLEKIKKLIVNNNNRSFLFILEDRIFVYVFDIRENGDIRIRFIDTVASYPLACQSSIINVTNEYFRMILLIDTSRSFSNCESYF